MNCIFCKIVNGEIPAYTIYEDELVTCFLDVNPDTNGHLLIIPKMHFENVFDIEQNVLNHILECAKKMGSLLQEKLNIDGLTLVQNNGCVQEVKHFHLHLKPVYQEKQTQKEIKEIYSILTK